MVVGDIEFYSSNILFVKYRYSSSKYLLLPGISLIFCTFPNVISGCAGQFSTTHLSFSAIRPRHHPLIRPVGHSLIDGLLMLSVIYLVAGVARSRQLTKLPYIHITMYYIPVRWCLLYLPFKIG